MNRRRTLGTGNVGLFVCCLLIVSSHGAAAQVYPPTKAGLQQLIADDSSMLPRPYAIMLQKKDADWERGVGVKCYQRWVGPVFSQIHCVSNGAGGIKCSKQTIRNVVPAFCFPAAKDVIADIQAHIFKVDGFVIDSTEWKDSMPSDGPSIANDGLPAKPITLDQVFPQIVSPNTPTTQAFNKAVTDFGLTIWSEEGGPPRSDPEQDDDEDVDVDYAQNPAPLPGVISISVSWGQYGHGAAHGEFGQYDFNWNVAQKRPVQISDIFDESTDWKSGLANSLAAAFQDALADYPLKHSYVTGDFLLPFVSDPSRWAILKTGIRLDTDTDELGGYSAGAPSAVASWSSLKPYLKHGGLAAP
jgi:hypothetical protein